jgi:hypothetical protein
MFIVTACDNGEIVIPDFTVSYDAGDGSGTPPADQNVAPGETIHLPDQGNMSAPSDKKFKGWRTNSQNYAPGNSFTVTKDTTFLAQWIPTVSGDDDPEDPEEPVEPGTANTTLPQAEPHPASSMEDPPKVLASYSDGTSNRYLVDVGYISDMLISELGRFRYAGNVGQSFGVSETNTTTVTNSLTTTISESIAISNTLGIKVSIGEEVGAKLGGFGVEGNFAVKTNLETSWSGTLSNTTTKSTSNTAITATAYSKGLNLGYVFKTDDPQGSYRYVIYGVCDVYFIIKTSPDKQTLLGWDTVVCDRPGYEHSFEYSADGRFTSEPAGTIDFKENFWKNLPSPPPLKTSYAETRSVNGDWDIDNIGHASKDEIFTPNLDIPKLKQFGYTKLKIDVSFDYRSDSVWGGNLRLQIANWNKTSELGSAEFSHTSGWGSYTRTSFSQTVSIDATNSDTGEFMLLWSRVENDGLFVCGYGVGNRTITITALK